MRGETVGFELEDEGFESVRLKMSFETRNRIIILSCFKVSCAEKV